MQFSRVAWGISALYMAGAAYISWREGTFASGHVTLGFVNHAGMWGDLTILPIVNALIVPHLPRITSKRLVLACGLLLCAITATFFANQQWAAMGRASGTTDFVFPTHSSGIWYRDMSVSGYLHFVYMSVELTLILAYVLNWMPVRTTVLVSALLTLHLIVGQVQPGWYSTGKIWNVRTIAPTSATVLLTWLVAFFKMRYRAAKEPKLLTPV